MREQKPPIIINLGGGITMTFRHIPAGRFHMGQRGGEANEEPMTEVELDEFWMGETPVTQSQYRMMAEGGIDQLTRIGGNLSSEPGEFKVRDDSASRRMENVNWCEARRVAEWVMEKMCVEGYVPPGYIVDLPPEDHWEYACRAGTDTEYWSGDGDAALAQVGWYGGNAGGATHPVREKDQRNAFGLHDMHGNLNEWCLDLYEPIRGRFRIPRGKAAAYEDRSRLVRTPPNPDYVAWVALFTRICGSEGMLHIEDFPVMVKLRDFGKRLVTNGDLSWGEYVLSRSEAALADGRWPENQAKSAEELREIFQAWVNSSSDSADPDRVLRGGSWGDSARSCRSACRGMGWPDHRYGSRGFRLCMFPGSVKQGQKATVTAAAGAKVRRDDAAVAEVADGADLNTNFPPRGGGDLF